MTFFRRLTVLVMVATAVAAVTAVTKFALESERSLIPVLDCPHAIDLGERDRGEIATGRFRVKNNGNAELQLTHFRTTCSCAGVEAEENGVPRRVQKVRIAPGKAIELAVRVAVGGRSGTPQRVYAEFQTNDPVRSIWTIEVLIPRIKGGIFADPNALIFGMIPREGQARQIVRVYDNGISGRKVEQVRSTQPERFDVQFLPPLEGKGQGVHESTGRLIGRVEVIAHTEQAGPLDGYVEVTLAGDPRPPSLIPVSGEVTSAVVCSPSMVLLPRTLGEQSVYSGQVLLTSRDGKPFQVEMVLVPDGLSATIRPTTGRPDQYLLQINCCPDVPATSRGVRESQIRFRVQMDTGKVEPLEVTVLHPHGVP